MLIGRYIYEQQSALAGYLGSLMPAALVSTSTAGRSGSVPGTALNLVSALDDVYQELLLGGTHALGWLGSGAWHVAQVIPCSHRLLLPSCVLFLIAFCMRTPGH